MTYNQLLIKYFIGNTNQSLKGYFNNVLSCIKRDSKDSNGKNSGKEDDEEAKYNARFNPDSQKCGAFEGIISIHTET